MTNEIISLPLHKQTAKISNGMLAILTTTVIRETFNMKNFCSHQGTQKLNTQNVFNVL